MDTLNRLKELKTFLLSLSAYKGLHIYHTTIADEVKATEIAVNQKLDMDDAIQYSSALSTHADAILSFDKHFDRAKYPESNPPKTRQKPIILIVKGSTLPTRFIQKVALISR